MIAMGFCRKAARAEDILLRHQAWKVLEHLLCHLSQPKERRPADSSLRLPPTHLECHVIHLDRLNSDLDHGESCLVRN